MPHAQGSRPPLVSIVLPCFVTSEAQARSLDETLASIGESSVGDLEVVVVDDGSPVEVARLVARHPRTFTVRQPTTGAAVARNTGIDVSRGSAFLFVDPGDQLLPSAIEDGLAALEAQPAAGFVAGAHEVRAGYETAPHTSLPPTQTRLYRSLLGGDWFVDSPATALFRRPIVEALGGFRDPWGADVLDFYLRAAYHSEAHTVATIFARCDCTQRSTQLDAQRILLSLHAVYDRQWLLVRGNDDAEAAHGRGLRVLGDRYLAGLIEHGAPRHAELIAVPAACTDVAVVCASAPATVAYGRP